MPKIKFTVDIQATPQEVWKNLWSDEDYRIWTAAFSEGSYAVSDWKEGSKIKFLSNNECGMYGIIQKKIENERMTFEHQGEIKNGIEEPKEWAGATEDYTLIDNNGATILTVEMDMSEDFKDYFNQTFPKALQLLKSNTEKQFQ